MKLIYKKGTTGSAASIVDIFIQDSTKTTGLGLAGLVTGSSPDSPNCYRARQDDGNAGGTAISLTGATRGTYTSGGFVEKDATNMPGVYEFGIPTAAMATGSNFCLFYFKGGSVGGNLMAPMLLEIELVDFDPFDTVRMGLTALPNVASGSAGAIPTTGTGANQISLSSGLVAISSAVKRGTATGTTALAGFTFVMTDSTTHAPAASLGTVTPTRSIDGGTFGACTNSVSAVANGTYKIDLSGNDLNGNTIMLRFTATGADDLNILIITQP